MKLPRVFGEGMMRGAELLAPPAKSEWVRGMRAEFHMLEDNGAALSWAGGCMWTALGLRLQAEAIYVLVLAAALTGWRFWLAPFFWVTDRLPGDAYFNGSVGIGACQAVLAFSLGVYKPQRIPLTALLVSLVGMGGVFLWWMLFVRGVWAPLGIWMVIGQMIFQSGWPAIPGALAAWVYLHTRRRPSAG